MASAKGKGKGKRRGDPPGDGTARWGRPRAPEEPLPSGVVSGRDMADNAKTFPIRCCKALDLAVHRGDDAVAALHRRRRRAECAVGELAGVAHQRPAELVAVHEVQRPIPSDYFTSAS